MRWYLHMVAVLDGIQYSRPQNYMCKITLPSCGDEASLAMVCFEVLFGVLYMFV